MEQLHYTTGEVAKILQVTPATIRKWIDRGQLKAFVRRGEVLEPWTKKLFGMDRLIKHDDLLAFMKDNGFNREAQELEASETT